MTLFFSLLKAFAVGGLLCAWRANCSCCAPI